MRLSVQHNTFLNSFGYDPLLQILAGVTSVFWLPKATLVIFGMSLLCFVVSMHVNMCKRQQQACALVCIDNEYYSNCSSS